MGVSVHQPPCQRGLRAGQLALDGVLGQDRDGLLAEGPVPRERSALFFLQLVGKEYSQQMFVLLRGEILVLLRGKDETDVNLATVLLGLGLRLLQVEPLVHSRRGDHLQSKAKFAKIQQIGIYRTILVLQAHPSASLSSLVSWFICLFVCLFIALLTAMLRVQEQYHLGISRVLPKARETLAGINLVAYPEWNFDAADKTVRGLAR